MAKVLILDQSKSMRNTLRERLEYEGFSTEAAEDEEAASNMCEKIPFDVILSDTGCKIPDKGVPFIVLSSEASIDSAVEAVRNGAQDYLTKPIDMNRLLQSIHRTIDDPAPVPAPAAAPARRTRRGHCAQTEHIIGTSPQIEHVRLLIDKVAPCEARVLITGENGTGKERHERFFIAGNPRSGTDRKTAAHIVMTRHAPDDGHRRRAGQAEARPDGRRTGKAGKLLRRHLGGKERQHAQRRGQYSESPLHRTRIVMRSTIRSAEVSPEISGSIPPELPSGLLWPTSTASNCSLPDDRSTSAA